MHRVCPTRVQRPRGLRRPAIQRNPLGHSIQRFNKPELFLRASKRPVSSNFRPVSGAKKAPFQPPVFFGLFFQLVLTLFALLPGGCKAPTINPNTPFLKQMVERSEDQQTLAKLEEQIGQSVDPKLLRLYACL